MQALWQNTWQIIPALLLMELVQLQLTDTIWCCGNCCWHCCYCCMNCARLAFTSWLKVSAVAAPAAAAEINLRRKTLPSVCSRWHEAWGMRHEGRGMRLATGPSVIYLFSLLLWLRPSQSQCLGTCTMKSSLQVNFSLSFSLSISPSHHPILYYNGNSQRAVVRCLCCIIKHLSGILCRNVDSAAAWPQTQTQLSTDKVMNTPWFICLSRFA